MSRWRRIRRFLFSRAREENARNVSFGTLNGRMVGIIPDLLEEKQHRDCLSG